MAFFKKIKIGQAVKLSGKEKKVKELQLKEEKKWLKTEGELTIDVYETNLDIVIQSPVAGVKPEDFDISIEDDMLEIRGIRKKPEEDKNKINYFHQECYWGAFSRKIILPKEVDNSRAKASIKEGVLTIKIPKLLRERRRKIKLKTTKKDRTQG